MKIIKNAIGWEDEFGFQLAYKEEFVFPYSFFILH